MIPKKIPFDDLLWIISLTLSHSSSSHVLCSFCQCNYVSFDLFTPTLPWSPHHGSHTFIQFWMSLLTPVGPTRIPFW